MQPGFLRWLGLAPLSVMATTAVDALLAGIGAILTLLVGSVTMHALRAILPGALGMPALVTMLAAFVGALGLAVQAWLPALGAGNARYLPLLIVHGALVACLGQHESFSRAARDGLAMGLGSLAMLLAIGTLRGFTGEGFRFALTPTAALVLLALLLVLKNRITRP